MIDGLGRAVGAGNCAGAANTYRNLINARLDETGGLSPIAIESNMEIVGDNCTVTATFRLVDPINISDLRATLLVYEDDVYWCCGYGGVDTWEKTTRFIYDENVVLTPDNNEVVVQNTFALNPTWSYDQIHAVAYVQQVSTKDMIQGQLVGAGGAFDYSMYYEDQLVSVPSGNGMAVFNASLTNIGAADDTFTLEPGVIFGDWATDFLVCGDPNPHTDPLDLVLAPDETCDIQIRVHTDSAVEVREGTFIVTAASSGRVQETNLRVFNGSYSILLVDNDGSWDHEVPIMNALDAQGYLYVHWDVQYGHDGTPPSSSRIAGYDYVVWETGLNFSPSTLGSNVQATLMGYMDNGGRLLLTSQMFLNNVGSPNTFTTDYLGIDSWVLDTAYEDLDGVPSDPIGDGLDMHMTYSIPTFKKGDNAIPGTATTFLTTPDGSNAGLRNEFGDNGKCIFLPCAIHSIDDNPDPNNLRIFLSRMLEWLAPTVPADVDDPMFTLSGSRIEHAMPNPFNPRTEISFLLSRSGASGPVSLEIFDLAGRKVAGIFEGAMTAGRHTETWTGLSDTGDPVESGVYFALLKTAEGLSSKKLVLLK